MLYDVTNTHFEGLCEANPKAARGKNKQKRNDCLQAAVGMAFDERGLALAHEVFKGNIGDARTPVKMPGQLGRHVAGKRKPVVILGLLTTRFPLEDGRIVSIRKASVPDEEQIRIYNMLGINWKSAYRPRKTEISS